MWFFKVVRRINWRAWRRRVKRAILKDTVARCCGCKEPIIPGDEVAEFSVNGNKERVMFHAGFHYSPKESNAHCNVPIFFKTGRWSARGIARFRAPHSEECLRSLQITL